MKIRIRFYGLVHDEVGTREMEYTLSEKPSVSNLLRVIVEQFPNLTSIVYDEEGLFRDFLELAVNNVSIISLNGLDTILEDGDLVLIMPPIGGG